MKKRTLINKTIFTLHKRAGFLFNKIINSKLSKYNIKVINIQFKPKENILNADLDLKGEASTIHFEFKNFALIKKNDENGNTGYFIRFEKAETKPEKAWLCSLLTHFLNEIEVSEKNYLFIKEFIDFQK